MKTVYKPTLLAVLIATSAPVLAHSFTSETKAPSATTQAFAAEQRSTLPFADKEDFRLVEKGLIAQQKDLQIKDASGKVVWELGNYSFLLDGRDYDSIHPSLQRQAQLNMHHGLYKVSERIYQVRGYDLANITFVQGDTGWIVFDPLTVPATAKAALDFVNQELGERPVKAVVYSHAHADHFGGVKGIVSQEQVDRGEVPIIAPKGFLEHAVAENVLAGNAMSRRTTYQYGNVLPKGATGQVDAAIGKNVAQGEVSLIAPTKVITEQTETLEIDGVTMEFQNTPGTESPAEMNTYFPQFKALWMAENTVGGLHNVYTLRGAEVRDAKAWSKYINESIHMYAKEADVMFASHTWPRWGNDNINHFLRKQRDMYGYIHDQALRLANHGVTINEIQDEFQVPDVLAHEWYNRGYHGSYHRNAKAVINKYLGYFDMNPATLRPLSPTDAAPKYVAAMGGMDNVLKLGKDAFSNGEYRWCAEIVDKAVFAEPSNKQARYLQADCLEQLGYQSESAGERNTYLMGAYELRNGVPKVSATKTAGADTVVAMDTELFLDYLGVRLNGDKAAGTDYTINFVLPDVNEKFLVELENAHLNNLKGIQSDKPDMTLTIDRAELNKVLMGKTTITQLAKEGRALIDGNAQALTDIASMMDSFEFWFNIIEPKVK
ncbi:alkyl/aryl-sulfatase [Vibrio navarrensis]|uniref:alkyl/aryl-sulfatase n=1 Tax=Vibrio navarrensis TaxID=29495 RepID=UPI001558A5D1|nr:alkyl/aryl-sulfatase [Vibrio navarrensis]EGR2796956.1 alkyl/aryl-sulfatase [Vibrio navarrensis]EJL6394658.1 alkyl/aryl-sulfatase [Vibrio navarrensis]EKA5635167.1 alkyl/aryl-sulfatase [Vibrio navarrensis]